MMKPILPLVLLIFVQATNHLAAAPESPKAATPQTPAERLAAFKSFFARQGTITEKEVSDRFGAPDSHGVLYLSQKTEPPSWEYYELGGGERIGVAVENQQVGMVMLFHHDHTNETIRPKKT